MPQQVQQVLILKSKNSVVAERLLKNASKALSNARVDFDVVCLEDENLWRDLTKYSCALLASDTLGSLTHAGAKALSDFVTRGGGLVALIRSRPSDLDALLGVRHHHYLANTGATESGGLAFEGQAMPFFTGIELAPEDIISHGDFGQAPASNAHVLATTYGGKPVAWSMQNGLGRCVYWSSCFLSERHARGLIVQSLEVVQQISMIPIANAGVVQLDDYPAPMDMPLPPEVIDGDNAISMRSFVTLTWYPDVLDLAEHYDIPLSTYAVFDYGQPDPEDQADPIATDLELRSSFNKVVANSQIELGLHGYNHFSLCMDVWQDPVAMNTSIAKAARAWQAYGCGALPTSYVPANNRIDAKGLAALLALFPTIKVLSSSVFGRFEDGGCREFGPEPWDETVFALPRISSGHECTQQGLFYGASLLANLGVWTHFIHSDDVCDLPPVSTPKNGRRNPNSRPWRSIRNRRGLFEELDKIFAFFRMRFPWLTFMKTTDAAQKVSAHLESVWTMRWSENKVHVSGPIGGEARMRLNMCPRCVQFRCKGCHLSHIDFKEDYIACIVTLSDRLGEIEIIRHKRWYDGLLRNTKQKRIETTAV